jgi:hypothetical protein
MRLRLRVPDDQVLLSRYGPWNDILDEVVDAGAAGRKIDPVGPNWERVFLIDALKEAWEEITDDIQACTPRIELDWVEESLPQTMPIFER